jgi:hypothetical protein
VPNKCARTPSPGFRRRSQARTNAVAAVGGQDTERQDVQAHAAVLALEPTGDCAHKLAAAERCRSQKLLQEHA